MLLHILVDFHLRHLPEKNRILHREDVLEFLLPLQRLLVLLDRGEPGRLQHALIQRDVLVTLVLELHVVLPRHGGSLLCVLLQHTVDRVLPPPSRAFQHVLLGAIHGLLRSPHLQRETIEQPCEVSDLAL